MNDPECILCGQPLADADEEAMNFYDHEIMGLVHATCLDRYEDDARGREMDYWHDMAGDR